MADLDSEQQSTWKSRGSGATGALSDDRLDINAASSPGALGALTLVPDSSDSESHLDSFISRLNRDLEYMRENLIESKQQRLDLMSLVTSLQLPANESQLDLDYQLTRLEISNLITTGMNYIALRQYNEAEEEINRALDLAERASEELELARCYYWLGRIQVEQRNFPLAYQYFKDAQTLRMDYRCLESHSLKFYLEFAKPGGVTKLELPFSDALHVNLGFELANTYSINDSRDLSKKRKWESPKTWSRVLRTSNSPRHTLKATNRLNLWKVLNTEDDIDEDHSSRTPSKPEISLDELEWAQLEKVRSRPPQKKSFTFRYYPRGLASRTRTTKIFTSEQPGENLMSADEWEVLQKHAKNKKVTMAYLANERRKYNGTDKRK
ncbi:hypothetical protein N7493_002628 [Penicillium malachiteum]|uniref:Uncharacterized protein n=1 Tax=Penicillium malachiteum TaxID=1324776 RepID=A0AAD6MYY5_9EURO|nr:hypothetical protein N7493_002628 [Penicillium malachiteum]